MEMEHKITSKNSTIESSKDSRTLSGFIPLFSEMHGVDGTYERFERNAFDNTKMDQCVLAYNHSLDNAVAGVSNGTLKFEFTNEGLVWKAVVANTSTGNDLLEVVRSGLASQCSVRLWHDEDAVEVSRASDGNDLLVWKDVYSLMDIAPTAQGHWGGVTLSRTSASCVPNSSGLSNKIDLSVLKLKLKW